MPTVTVKSWRKLIFFFALPYLNQIKKRPASLICGHNTFNINPKKYSDPGRIHIQSWIPRRNIHTRSFVCTHAKLYSLKYWNKRRKRVRSVLLDQSKLRAVADFFSNLNILPIIVEAPRTRSHFSFLAVFAKRHITHADYNNGIAEHFVVLSAKVFFLYFLTASMLLWRALWRFLWNSKSK